MKEADDMRKYTILINGKEESVKDRMAENLMQFYFEVYVRAMDCGGCLDATNWFVTTDQIRKLADLTDELADLFTEIAIMND